MTNEHEQRRHEQLCAYVLDECSPEERLEIEGELLRSPELRAQRDTIERTVGLLKSALSGSEALSPEAAETVISAASVSKPSARTWQSVPWMRIAAGLGAVALGVAILQRSGRRDEPEMARFEGSTSTLDADAGGKKWRTDADKSGLAAQASGLRDSGRSQPQEPSNQSPYDEPSGKERGELFATKDSIDRSESGRTNSKSDDTRMIGITIPGTAAHDDAQKAAEATAPDLSTVGLGKAEAPASSAIGARVSDGSNKKLPQTASPGGGTYRGPGNSIPPGGASSVGLAGNPAPTSDPSAGGEKAGLDGFFDRSGPALKSESSQAEAKQVDSGSVAALKPASTPSAPGASSGATAQRGAGLMPPAAKAPARSIGPSTGGPAPSSPAAPAEKAKSSVGERSRRQALPLDSRAGEDSNDALLQVEELDRDEPLLYLKLPVAEQQAYLDRECRRILDGCVRRPNERPRDMYFRFWGDNPFEVAALDPLSTFSADVDTASYTLARRYLREGNVPEKAQIRTEEFVNYFKSDVPAPTSGVFAIQTHLAPSRFSTDTTRQMMRVVVRGKDLSKVERNRLNLTFVVDVSGSMREQNRLEMVKHSMRLLATQLDQYDRIGIVKFSNDASVVLPLTSVAERAKIESAIEPLQPEGSTNSNAGLELGYAIALQGLDPQATNRVVFLSDGVANVGETDPAKITERVKPMRERGIYLNTIGVGMNNHNDVLLEQLANKGDGMCNYIDTPEEARRSLVDNFTGAFQPIARDVKIQVEFDPAQVLRYRLLGYENRAIADADFRNDKIDAGELGAGHQVTALYEIERQAANPQASAASEKPLATVRVRWKEPRNFGKVAELDTASEIAQPVSGATITSFEGAGQSYRKAVLAAQFAEILRRSIHARGDSLDDLLNESLKLQKEISGDADFTEFVTLVSKSKDLILRTMPACDELCQAIDSVRETYYRRAQLEQLQHEMDQKMVEDLKRQNDELEAHLREIVRRRLESQGR